jgi:hypothetical protein
MLGIDVGAWITTVIALGGRAPAEFAGHVPLLDPGPIASALALIVSAALVWHGRHKTI